MQLLVKGGAPIQGRLRLPGDKSLAHRAAIFASLADGRSEIRNFPLSADCGSTLSVLQDLGAELSLDASGVLRVEGHGHDSLAPVRAKLSCGRSGTTMRLLAGLLGGLRLSCELGGEAQLLRRPMARIVGPLRRRGVSIEALGLDGRAPLRLSSRHGELEDFDEAIPVASAQVKGALLLSGLFQNVVTRVKEPSLSRDHSERMLRSLGVKIVSEGTLCSLEGPCAGISPIELELAGDASSAAFPALAAVLCPGSDVELPDVLANPTRCGFFRALERMGGQLSWTEPKMVLGEPLATLRVRNSDLHAIEVEPAEVASMIDELPLLALAMTQAEGRSTIRGAAELRVKESDRIHATTVVLRELGADVKELEDGFEIHGKRALGFAEATPFGDHRIAMLLVVAGLSGSQGARVQGADCISDSYPLFLDAMRSLGARILAEE